MAAIPNEHGQLAAPQDDNLLTCALRMPVTVTRVIDQSVDFLRFVEHSQLKPGETVQVEDRDAAPDRVTLTRRGETIAIGARAAAKLMVRPA